MTTPRSTFRTATIFRLTAGLMALVAIVGMTFWLSRQAQSLFATVVEARDTRGAAVELRNELFAADSNAYGYLVSGNEIYLSPYDRAKVRAQRQLGVVMARYAPYGEMSEALKRLGAVAAQKFEELDAAVALKRARDDAGAIARFSTNRGKALMDEAQVYLSGLIRAADQRLTTSAAEQRSNAEWLRWFSIGGGVIVIIFVGSAAAAASQYTRELRAARDEVNAANDSLEQRVTQRTIDLAAARDKAELLVDEVNHRVANSLAMVGSLVSLQANATGNAAAKDVLRETRARIDAVAQVHKKLYTSGDVRMVALDDYLAGLVEHLAQSLKTDSRAIRITHDLDAIALSTDDSIGVGMIVTEWVTNAAKYAYPDGQGTISVRLQRGGDGAVTLAVEDEGVGRQSGAAPKGTGLGTRLVTAMAARLNGRTEYVARNPGTSARLVIAMPQAAIG